MSEQAGDALLQMQAYKSLGIMNTKLHNFDDALALFEKHYALVKLICANGANVSLLDNSSRAGATMMTAANIQAVIAKNNQQDEDNETAAITSARGTSPSKKGGSSAGSKPKNSTKASQQGNNSQPSSPSSKNNPNDPSFATKKPQISQVGLPTHHDVDMARVYVGVSRGNLLLKTVMSDLFVNTQLHLAPLLEWKIYRKDAFLQQIPDDEEEKQKQDHHSLE